MCHTDKSPWVICTLCRGDGTVVNPSIDAGGLSADDFADDPEFADNYRAGVYDITCPRCAGAGKLRAAELERVERAEAGNAADRRLAALEDGDAEGYRTAGDPRWSSRPVADEPDDGCTNPGGHVWNRTAGEADEARLAGDVEHDNIRCVYCGADGDA